MHRLHHTATVDPIEASANTGFEGVATLVAPANALLAALSPSDRPPTHDQIAAYPKPSERTNREARTPMLRLPRPCTEASSARPASTAHNGPSAAAGHRPDRLSRCRQDDAAEPHPGAAARATHRGDRERIRTRGHRSRAADHRDSRADRRDEQRLPVLYRARRSGTDPGRAARQT